MEPKQIHFGIPEELHQQKVQQRMELLQQEPHQAQQRIQQLLGADHFKIVVEQDWEDPIPDFDENA